MSRRPMSMGGACAAAALLLAANAPMAQEEPAKTRIKETDPATGRLTRRDAVRSSALPINRTYAQLTAEERQIVRDQYEGLPDADEPPFPAEGLRPIVTLLYEAQRKLGFTGDLFLVASVDETGSVQKVQQIGNSSPEMVRFAALVLYQTKFKPALCGGKVCPMDFPLRVGFDGR